MKILCVTHYYARHGGGIERVADRICRGLAGRGCAVTWAATDLPGETPVSEPGLVIEPIEGWSGIETRLGLPFPLLSLFGRRRLSYLAADADLIHIHDGIYPGGHAAALRARSGGKPIVVTQHIGDIPFRDPVRRSAVHVLNRYLTRPLLKWADVVVFVSRTVQRFFADVVPPERSRLVFNGVDLDVFSPSIEMREQVKRSLGLNPQRPTFLFVGRFVPKKGLRKIREAARALPEIDWLLAGRGPERPGRWGLGNVRTVGHLPPERLAPLYRAADLLVLPSVGEGFPLVVQEAMASGTPCLVAEETRWACPAAADGILSAGENAEDFLNACRRALQPGILERMRAGVAAIARREWSWDRCFDQYQALFERLVGGRPAPELEARMPGAGGRE